jgi:hypothetical protein
MLRAPRLKVESKAGRQKYVGITTDARTLGVERSHLWRVLIGERQSKSLLARYRALKQKQQAN